MSGTGDYGMDGPLSAEPGAPDAALDAAFDAALATALEPPAVPAGFRRRLEAALEQERQAAGRRASRAAALERERRECLAELEAGYVRLRRRTLGTLIGGAFAVGVAVTLAMPWLRAAFGADTPLALAAAGAVLGLALIAASVNAGRGGMAVLRLFW